MYVYVQAGRPAGQSEEEEEKEEEEESDKVMGYIWVYLNVAYVHRYIYK